MTPTPNTAFRLSAALLARLDAYAAQLSQQAGVPVSRTAVVVKFLTERLDAEDARGKKSRKK